MTDNNLLPSLIFIIWGGLSILKPELVLKFRAWLAKKIYAADYKFSQKTITIQRFFGILFILIGLVFAGFF